MKYIIRFSKFLHKWIGLLLVLFLAYMSISGILLNHPSLFSEIDVPTWLTPKQYELTNWNRSSMQSCIKENDSTELPAYIYGNYGVFKVSENGIKQDIMTKNFPSSAWNRRTRAAIITNLESRKTLLAGTYHGLYALDLSEMNWRRIELPEQTEKIMKIIRFEDSIYVFSDSELFIAAEDLKFRAVHLTKIQKEAERTILELFFELHTGEIWGLPGKLLFDLVAIILFFLSVSAFYMWIYPKKRKHDSRKSKVHSKRQLAYFQIFNKYHLKLGIFTFAILLIIGGTGLFMRPPLVAAILSATMSEKYYPGFRPANKFHGKIRNVLLDKQSGRFIIDAKDGLWAESGKGTHSFKPASLPVPIFAMGASVFEQDENGDFLVGSFSGLFRIDHITGQITDMLGGQPGDESTGRPSENLVTGYFKANDSTQYISTHFNGIACISGKPSKAYLMPEALTATSRLSLWNYSFELHNARFFADWIGNWYILVIPLASLLFLMLILSGLVDWLWRKRRKIKAIISKK